MPHGNVGPPPSPAAQINQRNTLCQTAFDAKSTTCHGTLIELLSAAPIQVSRKENTMSAPTSEIVTAAAPS
jgi:hypothetical protein